jgi:hypothetical protein
MSSSPQDILQSFDILPEAQQRAVFVELCRRAAQWESEPMNDGELARAADELFQELDERERLDGTT